MPLLEKVTCPHCWAVSETHSILWISSHPSLIGDLRLGRDEPRRFLTLCRAWFVAGRPTIDLPSWGSFEGWSNVVRQLLVWAGLPDPAATRHSVREQGDPRVRAMAVFLEGLELADPNGWGLTSREIMERVQPGPTGDGPTTASEMLRNSLEVLVVSPGPLTAVKLGKALSKHLDRPAGGRKLERGSKDRTGSDRWKSCRIAPKPTDSRSERVLPLPEGTTPAPHVSPASALKCRAFDDNAGVAGGAGDVSAGPGKYSASDIGDEAWF